MTSKVCAYCGVGRSLTREHIWPNGFLRRGDFGVKFSSKAQRVFGGDLIIKDVCGACNNGPLSVLDNYACELYDTYFGQFPEHFSPVKFEYDYTKLTSWLLKIAFNSARSQGHRDAQLLSSYRQVVLAAGECTPIYVSVRIALVGPGFLDYGNGRPGRTIYPKACRSGPVIVPGANGYQHVSTRLVMINGYFFTLVLSRAPSLPSVAASELIRRMPGAPLALDGKMELVTTMNANQALEGVERWPGRLNKRR